MSTQLGNNQSSLDNLSEHGSSKSATSGITGGSTGAFGSGKGKEGSTPIGTYDTSTHHNAPGSEQIDSWSGGIPGTQTNENLKQRTLFRCSFIFFLFKLNLFFLI